MIRGPVASADAPPALAGSAAGIDTADLRAALFPPIGDDPPALSGCSLEHFAVSERIGNGGMGSVFRATDERLQRTVALKVLSPANGRDRASVLRFRNEARAAARLDHANVARVFYVGEDRGMHFIAFEFVEGKTVRDLLAARGPLPPEQATNIARQIADALRHCDAAGVVHRDVKPSNIIVTPAGRAKLVDLGLARKQAADSVGDLTVSGTTLGTFDYIAPEQAKDPRAADVRSDIYSLGCTLYHMLVGRPPYPEGTVLQKLLDHQNRETPDPRGANGRVPADLALLCKRMMASDPRERPQTPDDLLDALDELPGARSAGEKRRRDRTGALAAAGTLALSGLLAAVVWARWPGPRPAPPSTGGPAAVAGADGSAPAANFEDDIPAPRVTPLDPDAVAAAATPTVAGGDAAEPGAGGADAEVGGARANTAAAVGPPPAPATPPQFIVSAADGTAARTAATFAAAVEEAKTGEVVTVNVDGLLEPLRRAVRLVGKELVVRAGVRGDGTPYRPRLSGFLVANDPKAFFHLSGRAALALVGLDISLQLKNEEDGWGVFSVGGGDAVTLEDCTVTVLGQPERAAFNAAVVVRGFQPAMPDLVDPAARERVDRGRFAFTARRCLLRGQCDLLRIEPDRPGTLSLTDTAVSVQAAVLRMGGADPELYPFPGEGGQVVANLDHATLLFGEAFADLRWKSVEQQRPPLPVRVIATASLFVDADDATLIRTGGGGDMGQFLARLNWTGRENQYALGEFWKASGVTNAVRDPAVTFEDWQRLAETSAAPVSDVGAGYRVASLDTDYKMRFAAQVAPSDFRPKVPAGEDPASLMTADGERVGAQVADLPPSLAAAPTAVPASAAPGTVTAPRPAP